MVHVENLREMGSVVSEAQRFFFFKIFGFLCELEAQVSERPAA